MKLKTRPVAGIVCVMALGATLAACSSGSSSSSSGTPAASASSTSALTTVSVGDFPNSALTLPFAIAQDQGYFRDAGLNVQAVSAASGPVLASELIGGSTQIAVEVPTNAFPAMKQGEPLVAMPPYGRLDLAIVTPDGSGVTSLKSLVGKKIGVTALGSATETFAEYVLQTPWHQPEERHLRRRRGAGDPGSGAEQPCHRRDGPVLGHHRRGHRARHQADHPGELARRDRGAAWRDRATVLLVDHHELPVQPPGGREGLLHRDDAGDGLPGRQREPQRRPADHREAARRPGLGRRRRSGTRCTTPGRRRSPRPGGTPTSSCSSAARRPSRSASTPATADPCRGEVRGPGFTPGPRTFPRAIRSRCSRTAGGTTGRTRSARRSRAAGRCRTGSSGR